jgi:thioredoxin 1
MERKEFDELISSGTHLVDFYAEWCGPCKMLKPVVEGLKEEYSGKAGVHIIDVDGSKDLATSFGVRSIPTVIIFKDGEEVSRTMGYKSKDFFTEKINENLLAS